VLIQQGITLSMNGRGRALDNVFVERLWRTVKVEDVYLKGYETLLGLSDYFLFYNGERRHQSPMLCNTQRGVPLSNRRRRKDCR